MQQENLANEVTQIINLWDKIAESRVSLSSEQDEALYEDYTTVLTVLKGELFPLEFNERIYGALDNNGLLQGLIKCTLFPTNDQLDRCVKKREILWINTLFTAAWNLRLSAPNDETCKKTAQKGAGSALLHHAIHLASLWGIQEVGLSSLETAKEFYIDSGFQPDPTLVEQDVFWFSTPHSKL